MADIKVNIWCFVRLWMVYIKCKINHLMLAGNMNTVVSKPNDAVEY